METVMNPLMNINELYFDYKGMEMISQYLPLVQQSTTSATFMYLYYGFGIATVLPYLSWLAAACVPVVLLLSSVFIVIGIILNVFAFLLGGATGYVGFWTTYLVLVLLAIFGEIFLIPMGLFSPVSLILTIVFYYLSTIT